MTDNLSPNLKKNIRSKIIFVSILLEIISPVCDKIFFRNV